MDVIKAYATNNLCYKAAQKMKPEGIVVHSTGANNPNLWRYVNAPEEVGENKRGNHWDIPKPEGKKMCVHAFIGLDKNGEVRVAELLPLDICCWGVGRGKNGSYNDTIPHIQFEICEDGLKDEEYYNKVFGLAVEYCAHLCVKCGISPDHIVGHCEAHKRGYGSNHRDPEHWMRKYNDSMESFRMRVVRHLLNEDHKAEIEKLSKKSFRKGDLVELRHDAVYYSRSQIPLWVKTQRWYIKDDPVGNRAIIDKNENGTNYICSPISTEFLIKVEDGPDN